MSQRLALKDWGLSQSENNLLILQAVNSSLLCMIISWNYVCLYNKMSLSLMVQPNLESDFNGLCHNHIKPLFLCLEVYLVNIAHKCVVISPFKHDDYTV